MEYRAGALKDHLSAYVGKPSVAQKIKRRQREGGEAGGAAAAPDDEMPSGSVLETLAAPGALPAAPPAAAGAGAGAADWQARWKVGLQAMQEGKENAGASQRAPPILAQVAKGSAFPMWQPIDTGASARPGAEPAWDVRARRQQPPQQPPAAPTRPAARARARATPRPRRACSAARAR